MKQDMASSSPNRFNYPPEIGEIEVYSGGLARKVLEYRLSDTGKGWHVKYSAPYVYARRYACYNLDYERQLSWWSPCFIHEEGCPYELFYLLEYLSQSVKPKPIDSATAGINGW